MGIIKIPTEVKGGLKGARFKFGSDFANALLYTEPLDMGLLGEKKDSNGKGR